MKWAWYATILLISNLFPLSTVEAAGVNLSFSPNQGQYLTDSTFDISLLINTNGQAINALELYISFPADKLQIVSPTNGNSFISFWVAGPSYSNVNGTMTFQGGLPNPGITTSAGVVSTVKFRAKSAGRAVVKYQANSKVLANDGSGSSLPVTSGQAVIDITAAPPGGPVVTSSSHENPGVWYANPTFIANWESVGNQYSYVFDQSATTTPDEIAETTGSSITESVKNDGLWYFHIRAKNNGVWGTTTHFSFKVDTTPPAKFNISRDTPTIRTGERGIFSFLTTDSASGVDHYEVRIISQSGNSAEATTFIEATSPFQLPKLADGRYRLIVRATDLAGNSIEQSIDFDVGVTATGPISSRPLLNNPVLINIALIMSIFLLLILLLILLKTFREKHRLNRIMAEVRFLQQEIQSRREEITKLETTYSQATDMIRVLPQGGQAGQSFPTQRL